uniref:Serpin domain-containing protein n=1 Tax=Oryctolagus cuniculus TaxID=9986 RepID=G1SRN4_RABIT
NTGFAFRLYHLVASERPGANIFFSPLSVSVTLALLSLGARSNTQILQGLGFNLTELPRATIHQGFRHLLHTLSLSGHRLETHVGSSLFLSQDLEPLPRLFRTNFREPEDAAQLINDHVRAETRGKITDLVRELKPSTQLVLANYIYFKALWEKPFILAQTKPQDFYVDESTVVQVPMMLQHQQHRWYLQDQHLACSVLRMDYKGGASALFVLPDRGKMAQVEEALTPGTLRGWDSLNFYKPLELHLPKFSISGSYLLNQILPKLGFTELVSPRADFSGISEREKLQVSRSFHKATLDIDEAGTEAAAAMESPLWFNWPFLVVISSPSAQGVLFLGRVVNPTKL